MIYKGHDLRYEREHIRVTDLKTGISWTEDTLTEAKKVIDVTDAMKKRWDDIDEKREGMNYHE